MDINRRQFIGVGASALAAGLAGCSSSGGEGNTETNTSTSTSQGKTATSTPEDTSYTVSMSPTGDVTLEKPPESVAHYFPGYADMAVALGHGDTINSMGLPSRYHTNHYTELDGVSIDKESLTKLVGDAGISKEIFYDLDSDLHMIDPQWLIKNNTFGLDAADIEEISEKVSPFFGNTIFRRTDKWHDYRYYTLYDAFEKVAEVHQEQEKFSRLKSFHDQYITDIQTKLPGPNSRPNALLCWQGSNEPETFYPARLSGKGTNKKAFHDVGITDALSGTGIDGLSESNRGTIDYETVLEIDPDSILLRGHEQKTREEFENTVVKFMKNHEVASELRAVKNGKVFRGGPIYPGPLHHLFLVERYATGYFPDTFSGELFDREELASIITS
ncbi:ferrichrome-binding protein [Halogeometricum borinquense DSM 11551]|uniref:Ferrichrome-binding protein n=1 Tax=Halogeometricum borinquense (strain ATCC 700274 / DSM 11551 / JCM 10706 / KCTC 4070 / PR3) TaxID=469382 RepID=E4NW68_HALBP|nr:ABC transporter substrate-binding protein [Halogeometricum borinquense]ADQ69288.1 ferrichrome-binding protein [Halogeometricum borinquense DSM 11551]ELY31771.1 ferrichrome-binding protein [Halogeometricum borinquense DSM 11551]